jgi:hypothetical protein
MIAFCHEYHPRLLKTYHNYKQSKEVEVEAVSKLKYLP